MTRVLVILILITALVLFVEPIRTPIDRWMAQYAEGNSKPVPCIIVSPTPQSAEVIPVATPIN